jgi:hypothetical protein
MRIKFKVAIAFQRFALNSYMGSTKTRYNAEVVVKTEYAFEMRGGWQDSTLEG